MKSHRSETRLGNDKGVNLISRQPHFKLHSKIYNYTHRYVELLPPHWKKVAYLYSKLRLFEKPSLLDIMQRSMDCGKTNPSGYNYITTTETEAQGTS